MAANSNSKDLAAGKWQVSLAIPLGWEPVLPYRSSFDVTLNYGSSSCVEVRFKVKRPISVDVLKIDDNHVPLADWVIQAAPASGNWFASPITATTDGNGIATFRLTEGKWIFTETPPSGQKYMPVMPTDGRRKWTSSGTTPGPPEGGKISIRFKNRLYFKGCIVAYQDGCSAGSEHRRPTACRAGRSRSSAPTARSQPQGVTDAQGIVRFNNLAYGPYIVTEEAQTGLGCRGRHQLLGERDRGRRPMLPDIDGCEQVDFVNRQNPPGFSIEGYKIDHNGMIGIPGWVMTATAVYKGDYPDPNVDFDPITLEPMSYLTATTDGTGKYVFNFPTDDYRIPGAAYKICEEQRAGWLPHTAHLPDGLPAHEARQPGQGLELREPAGRPLGEHHAWRQFVEQQRFQLQHHTCSVLQARACTGSAPTTACRPAQCWPRTRGCTAARTTTCIQATPSASRKRVPL